MEIGLLMGGEVEIGLLMGGEVDICVTKYVLTFPSALVFDI